MMKIKGIDCTPEVEFFLQYGEGGKIDLRAETNGQKKKEDWLVASLVESEAGIYLATATGINRAGKGIFGLDDEGDSTIRVLKGEF